MSPLKFFHLQKYSFLIVLAADRSIVAWKEMTRNEFHFSEVYRIANFIGCVQTLLATQCSLHFDKHKK